MSGKMAHFSSHSLITLQKYAFSGTSRGRHGDVNGLSFVNSPLSQKAKK